MREIGDHGQWIGTRPPAYFDEQLAAFLVKHLAGSTVLDLGCGVGRYVHELRAAGIAADGYDGHPNTAAITGGVCGVVDLAEPFDLGRRWDAVLCLEVVEHVPAEFEAVLLGNLNRHCRHTLVLSWAWPGQGGIGHVNERPGSYAIERLEGLGFQLDEQATIAARRAAFLSWFRSNLLIGRRL